MPLVELSSYRAPLLFLNRHVQTVYPRFFRRIRTAYERERILTPDRDFLDLDWSRCGSDRLAIISHGLEGSSRSSYVTGMVRALNASGWDALAWNFRSCSGEANWQPVWYHGGQSDDLRCVFSRALFAKRYARIALVGFSLGGNLTLKFLGEHGNDLAPLVSGAAVFSVPCCLRSAAEALAKGRNRWYTRHFLNKLKCKVSAKIHLLPERFQKVDLRRLRTFKDFDNAFTGPVHGFADAADYWGRCSSAQFIPSITVPSLIVNALDDPFLGDGCYPFAEAAASRRVCLECPARGGHVGFVNLNHGGSYWSERRAAEFLESSAEQSEETPKSAGNLA